MLVVAGLLLIAVGISRLHDRSVVADVLNAVSGLLLLLLLKLQLKFEEFDFLLLPLKSEFIGGGLPAVLAVVDQAGEDVAADADELALGLVPTIESCFIGKPIAMISAIALVDVNASAIAPGGDGG